MKKQTVHQALVEQAKEAINKMVSDKSVPIADILSDLEDLEFEIDASVEALKDDLEAGRT